MTLETVHEELKISQQQLRDSEIERKHRIQSMISIRGLQCEAARFSESAKSETDLNLTSDKLIEDHLEKEQQL